MASHKFTAYYFNKRLFDIFSSFFGLLFLSPFFLLIAILIKRESPGPVYYRCVRVGRNGRLFEVLKFRTMVEPPPGEIGSPLTSREDERVTPFGQWLRDTKVNELPQLWNVLKGQMSLVGPRPEDPVFVEKWPQDARDIILSVRPGVTSPASVSYRDEQDKLDGTDVVQDYLDHIAPHKLRLDVLYVRRQSFLTDLDIIFMTIIMLLPLLRKVELPERAYYTGPFFQIIRRYLSWFVIDALVALVSITISVLLWRLTGPMDLGWLVSLGFAVGIAILFTLFNFLLGVNRISWRQAGPGWILKLMVSSGLVIFVLSLLNVSRIPLPRLPVPLIWLIGALTLFGMIIVRYRERLLTGLATRWLNMRKRAVGEFIERALIVGAGQGARLVGWLLNAGDHSHSLSIVGMVDDNPALVGMRMGDYRVLGSIEEIPRIVEQKGIGVILYSINNASPAEKERIIAICRRTSARLVLVPDYIKMFTDEVSAKEKSAA